MYSGGETYKGGVNRSSLDTCPSIVAFVAFE